MLRTADQDRGLGFSFPTLDCSGANINTFYRTAGLERHVWSNDRRPRRDFCLGFFAFMLHQQVKIDGNHNGEVAKGTAVFKVAKGADAIFTFSLL